MVLRLAKTVSPDTPTVQNLATKKSFYRPELDALRFVAFLLVFLFHLSLFRANRGWLYTSVTWAGSYGMSLFFVLSSYLITTLLIKERALTGTVTVWKFYVRRVLRIWPLYIFFLLTMYFVGRFYPPWFMHKANLAAFLLLSGNWYLLYAVVPGPVMPLWSISLEEQFYLFWPTLFKSMSLRRFVQASVATIVLSWVTIICLRANGVPVSHIWWNTIPQLQFFAIGALLAIFGDRLFLKPTTFVRVGSSIFGGLCFIIAGLANDRSVQGSITLSVMTYVLAGAGCVMIFQAFRDAHPYGVSLYLGRISYGLYVFHQISLDLVDLWCPLPIKSVPMTGLLGFGLTVTVASLSYRLIEMPYLRWKKRFEIVRSR